MSFTRKTLKILALIYFVLGIASLVTAGVGIATGGLDSTYGSYATLAAVVLIAKGLVDLAAGVAGIKGANRMTALWSRNDTLGLSEEHA